MFTNIPKQKIPPDLARYLKGRKGVDLLRKRPDRLGKPIRSKVYNIMYQT